MKLYQTIILTSHPVSDDSVQRIMKAIPHAENEKSVKGVYRLQESVEFANLRPETLREKLEHTVFSGAVKSSVRETKESE